MGVTSAISTEKLGHGGNFSSKYEYVTIKRERFLYMSSSPCYSLFAAAKRQKPRKSLARNIIKDLVFPSVLWQLGPIALKEWNSSKDLRLFTRN